MALIANIRSLHSPFFGGTHHPRVSVGLRSCHRFPLTRKFDAASPHVFARPHPTHLGDNLAIGGGFPGYEAAILHGASSHRGRRDHVGNGGAGGAHLVSELQSLAASSLLPPTLVRSTDRTAVVSDVVYPGRGRHILQIGGYPTAHAAHCVTKADLYDRKSRPHYDYVEYHLSHFDRELVRFLIRPVTSGGWGVVYLQTDRTVVERMARNLKGRKMEEVALFPSTYNRFLILFRSPAKKGFVPARPPKEPPKKADKASGRPLQAVQVENFRPSVFVEMGFPAPLVASDDTVRYAEVSDLQKRYVVKILVAGSRVHRIVPAGYTTATIENLTELWGGGAFRYAEFYFSPGDLEAFVVKVSRPKLVTSICYGGWGVIYIPSVDSRKVGQLLAELENKGAGNISTFTGKNGSDTIILFQRVQKTKGSRNGE
ncbi:MAG TPA: hypothetical protein DDW49_03520 [Deltaproteobacteria bacterium]|nr:MAG: hypothetical protein A2048_08550 [Deltaproteobacteria bacterium GWA2_45_12]HBF12449.1 hypothetical protein [Deltaproteobacteria bacterium]